MSEQRFSLRKYGNRWEVFDKETLECYTIHSVSGLLNEQQATIKQLQEENIELKKLRKYCANWIGVKEENLYEVVR